MHGNLLINAGLEFNHNTDATTRLRNQTGTYYYSSVENFASDALAFSAYGISGQLNPMDQHNCDQTGRPGVTLPVCSTVSAILPCYSYYSQTMGPADWWLSTNDWAGYLTSQWQPAKRTVLTLAMRWELQQLPPPISALQNPDLPAHRTHARARKSVGSPRRFCLGRRREPLAGPSRWAMACTSAEREILVWRLRSRRQAHSRAISISSCGRQTISTPVELRRFPTCWQAQPANVVKPGAVEFAPNFRNGEIHQAEADRRRNASRAHSSGSRRRCESWTQASSHLRRQHRLGRSRNHHLRCRRRQRFRPHQVSADHRSILCVLALGDVANGIRWSAQSQLPAGERDLQPGKLHLRSSHAAHLAQWACTHSARPLHLRARNGLESRRNLAGQRPQRSRSHRFSARNMAPAASTCATPSRLP